MIVALLFFLFSLNAIKTGVHKENETIIKTADDIFVEMVLNNATRSGTLIKYQTCNKKINVLIENRNRQMALRI